MNIMNKNTKIRGIVAIIFSVLSLVTTLELFINHMKSGLKPDQNVFSVLISSAIFGFVLVGFVVGLSHIPAIHKKIKKVLKVPFIGWMAYLVLIIAVPYLGGWIFMLNDLVKFLKARKAVQ